MVFITEGATMSDGITEATRYDTAAIQKFRQSIRKEVIESFTTKELVAELSKREGVKEIVVDPYIQYSITTYTQQDPYTFLRSLQAYGGSGAARILVVTE